MEAKRWKGYPEFTYSRKGSSPNPNHNKMERVGGGPPRTVALAPSSRYMMRKPLFSAEQHASILKKTEHMEEEQAEDRRTRSRAQLTSGRCSRPRADVSSASASTEDHDSPSRVPGLTYRCGHAGPGFGSCLCSSRPAEPSLSSSGVEVQRLDPPPTPRMTFAVPYPTWIPRSAYSRPRRIEGDTNIPSYTGHSTPYNLQYWACAVPEASPPSPDRQSRDWDPNREYQALLDYTYPLRAGQRGGSERHEDGLLHTDLQDSGIELEHLCSSTTLSGLDISVNGHGKSRERSSLAAGHESPDWPGFSRSLDDLACSTPLILKNPEGFSLDILGGSGDGGDLDHHAPTSPTPAAFISSTAILPQSRCVEGEVDEEFWPLPEQLEELQLLSRQVREVTAQLSQPIRASLQTLEPGTTSVVLPETQSVCQDTEGGKDEVGRQQSRAAQTTASHRRPSAASVESVGAEGRLSPSHLGEVEVLVKQLCGLALHGNQGSRLEDQEQNDSLLRHVQVFCSHLEQLIHRLYTVSEKMEMLSASTVDIDDMKSTLAEYQREVSSHRPLISRVLQTGQLLLSCINSVSPFLRDALLLIERQSGALQTYPEHFLSSVLSAMDSLTRPSQPSEPSPVQKIKEGEAHPVNKWGSTM